MVARTRVTTSDQILKAAAELLRGGGFEAVSTRAVAAAAGTQPTILYRQFGHKQGLLEAVTLHILQEYIANMSRLMVRSDDAVDDLRRLWDLFVTFAAEQPDCIALIYGHRSRGEAISATADTMRSILEGAIARIGDDGLLTMSVERATALFRIHGVGFVITQMRIPPAKRDPALSAIARENALANITMTSPAPKAPLAVTGRATALRRAIEHDDVSLTPAERLLMLEWLNRIADRGQR